jgi:hypothetical protein
MTSTYDKLIAGNGQPRYGIFPSPVREINVEDFEYIDDMDRIAGRVRKHFGFNQFQFMGVMTDDLIFGCALVDIKYVGNSFVYLYDRKRNELWEKSVLMPLALTSRLSRKPDAGESRFRAPGIDVSLIARDAPRQRELNVRVGGDLNARLFFTEPETFAPLSICTKTGFSGWTYTQKAAGIEVNGRLECKGRSWSLSPDAKGGHARGSYDWTAGYMRRETTWNWACLAGHSTDGSVVGVNFSSGVNETEFNENVFWVNGKLVKVGQTRFHYDRTRREGEWRIQSDDGKVDLRFEADGSRKEKIDAVILATNFTQLFGRFYGRLTDDEGQEHRLSGVGGFTEDHYARW